jgi:hypothetical protein
LIAVVDRAESEVVVLVGVPLRRATMSVNKFQGAEASYQMMGNARSKEEHTASQRGSLVWRWEAGG